MSSKSSILLINGIHIYKESLSEEVCVDLEPLFFERINKKYETPVLSHEEISEVILKLQHYLNNSEGFKWLDKIPSNVSKNAQE